MTQGTGHQSTGGADPTAAGGPGGDRLPRPEGFEIAGGASSSRPAGDAAALASGKPGAVQPPPAPRPEYPEHMAVYLPVGTAVLAAVGAVERGETPGSFISRAVVEMIQRNGGIARLAAGLPTVADRKLDRASAPVRRPAGAPAAAGGDAAREAKEAPDV